MIPKSKTQWALSAAVVVSLTWLYSVRNFEPLLASITSLIAYVGSFAAKRHSSTKIIKPGAQVQGTGPAPMALIRSSSITDRPHIIKKSHLHFPLLNGYQILEVLEILSITDRLDALQFLLIRLESSLSEEETEEILGTLSITDRPTASMQIAKARPINN